MQLLGTYKCEVIKYNTEKGFGFMKVLDERISDDVFVHYSEINKEVDGFKKLQSGQIVLCEIYRGKKGLIGIDVKAGDGNENFGNR